jgi:hypothetical protein
LTVKYEKLVTESSLVGIRALESHLSHFYECTVLARRPDKVSLKKWVGRNSLSIQDLRIEAQNQHQLTHNGINTNFTMKLNLILNPVGKSCFIRNTFYFTIKNVKL